MELKQAAEKIRLIALDLDGSSMNSKGVVSGRTRHAIAGLVRKGYEVVPATGRGFYHLRENIIGVSGLRYVISANGAVITDGITGRRIEENLIPCRTAASLAEKLLRPGTCVYIHRNDEQSTHILACRDRAEYSAWFARPGGLGPEEIRTEKLGEFILADNRDVIKLGAFFHGFDGFSFFEDKIGTNYPGINSFRVSDCSMEFTSSRASKANALRSLCGYLHIPLEQVCAVGDNGNDVEMLWIAGLGVAMGNAIEAAKQTADAVIGSNDDDGAAAFFEEYFLG